MDQAGYLPPWIHTRIGSRSDVRSPDTAIRSLRPDRGRPRQQAATPPPDASSLFFTQNTQTCPIVFPKGGAHTLPSYAGRCKGYETQAGRRGDSIRHTRVKARGPKG